MLDCLQTDSLQKAHLFVAYQSAYLRRRVCEWDGARISQHSVSLFSMHACLCSRLFWFFSGECSVRSSNDLAAAELGGKAVPGGESLLGSSSMVAIRWGSALGSEEEVVGGEVLPLLGCPCTGRAAVTEEGGGRRTGALMMRRGASIPLSISIFWERKKFLCQYKQNWESKQKRS